MVIKRNITSETSFLIAHCGSMLSDEESLKNKASYIVTCQYIGHIKHRIRRLEML